MIIIKIGGGEAINLSEVVKDLATLNQPFIVVHGANAVRDHIVEKMDFTKKVVTSISGYSSVFSDDNAIDAILMAYSGLRNKRLVELFQQHGVNAVGLTGLDGRLVQGVRNKGIRVMENGKKMLKRDCSGKPKSINTRLINLLMDNGYVPVLTIPICDENGNAVNSENDDIVVQLQLALGADTVIQLIEAAGLMEDVSNPASLIRKLNRSELSAREQQAQGRMKRKLHALNRTVRNGMTRIIICDGRIERPIINALAGGGTWIE